LIRSIQQGLLAEGIRVSISKLCAWFCVPRRTVYYKPTKAAPKIDPSFADPIKALIEQEPSFGYRTVAWLLGFNKKTVQRIFQLNAQEGRRHAAPDQGCAFCCHCPERTMVDGSCKGLDRQGWLVVLGPRHRLPYP
jgi:hypothetical protein